jgi:hypothetical protein
MFAWNNQVKEALKHGAKTIERQRREMELLSIKAEAFEAISGLVRLLSNRGGVVMGAGHPDAPYIMRELLERIEKEEHEHFLQQNDIKEE